MNTPGTLVLRAAGSNCDYETAYADMRETVRLNPNFSPGLYYLSIWGVN